MIAAILAGCSDGRATQPQQDRPPQYAEFAISVAAQSGFVFVAASPEKSGKRGPGAIHLFQRRDSAWVEAGVLPAPELTVEDPFGPSMATDGNTLVVGAQFADMHGADSGLAYVFERRGDGWHQAAVLSASDAESGDQFGLTVSVSGDTIAVGARLEDSRGNDAGATYVFERRGGTWQQAGKLTATDAARGDLFGRVSIDKDTMIVSADFNDDRGNAAGKAYAFEKREGVWTEVAGITASDGAAGDEFGLSLALRGDNAVFGAVGSDVHGEDSGAAYVFERRARTWVQVARLVGSDGAVHQAFGWSVAIGDDVVVVGAPNDRKGTGVAYVFERRAGAWTQTAKLGASDAAPMSRFGTSVCATGNTIVVGVLLKGGGTHPGAAYVFERRGGSWSEVGRLVRP